MDIETLQTIFISSITSNTPLLTDFSSGSINYTLTRGIAGGLLDLYNKIDDIENNFLLSNTQGELLTQFGASLNMSRIVGFPSEGYVILENRDNLLVNIPANLLLTDPISLLQFRLAETNSIRLLPYSQQRVKIRSIINSFEANLSAGINLLSNQFLLVDFIIGNFKTSSGKYCGDLTGGLASESDNAFRDRILNRFTNNINSFSFITDFLYNEGDIKKVLYETLTGGLVTIWVLGKISLNSARVSQLQDIINTIIPLGVLAQVKVLKPIPLNFKLKVYNQQSNLITLKDLRTNIDNFINSLSYKETLSISTLKEYLIRQFNLSLDINLPIQDVSIFNSGEAFILNELEVNYSV